MNSKYLFLFIICSALLLTACKGIPNQAADSAQQEQRAAFEQLLVGIDDPLLREHLMKQFLVSSYRTINDSSGRGQISTTEFTLSADLANFRNTITEDGKIITDMIVIGDTTYVFDSSDNSWWMQKIESDGLVPAELPDSDEFVQRFEASRDKVTYTSLGKETCGSLSCHKYQEITEGTEGVRTFWFDEQNLLLRREEFTYGEFTTVNVYEYENVSVTAPSPTKSVPQGRSVYEYMSAGVGAGATFPADFPAAY